MMGWTGAVPRRSVNLPPGTFRTLLRHLLQRRGDSRSTVQGFERQFGRWLGAPHVFGTSSGRTAFLLALEALGLEEGREIIFPVFTFPVMPMVAHLLGYRPVFCRVDPETFNAGPEHIAESISPNTGAVLATHLFGQPCPIREIMELVGPRNIRVLEDCAHACGVRVEGRQVGTFGDVGIFSFAEGKNMPCFGGGAIATSDREIAERARKILSEAPTPSAEEVRKKAVSIWLKWLFTRPLVFGLTAYPALRVRLLLGKPLMDSTAGNELLEEFSRSRPQVGPMVDLQAVIGLLHLKHIDAFNQGARRNAQVLTEHLGEIPGIQPPHSTQGGHIYVYYPLAVDPNKRDDLRHYLLRHGIDSKITDMADCSMLAPFREYGSVEHEGDSPTEASILEICVYPMIPEREMKRIASLIRAWAGLKPISGP